VSYSTNNGWFTKVNDLPVVKRDVGLNHTTYTSGFPKAILFHYTAGCGSDISSVLKGRGSSVTFSVDRDGKIYEYLPLDTAGWHAFSMSHFAVGIEHTALKGTCDLTDVQLTASSKLSGAIREYVQTKHGFSIPLVKLPAPVTLSNVKPGFFDHKDGDGSWNENGHTDGLYRWTWKQYLDAVRNAEQDTGGDDLALADFIEGIDASVAGKDLNPDWSKDKKDGFRLSERIKKAALTPEPGTPAPHSHNLEGTAT